MKVNEIINLLDAEVLCGDAFETEIGSAFGSDMMSDVLAFVNEQALLLTGLCNPQVVRTAEMMDISCICFVRGKKPDASVVALAVEKNIMLIATKRCMYSACGELYKAGLEGN